MTTEDFMALWCDTDLRQYIVDQAKLFTRRHDWQKELVCYAWFVLGETKSQKTTFYYKVAVKLFMKKRLLELKYGGKDE